MSRVRVQIMNQLDLKSHEYKAIKRYWKQPIILSNLSSAMPLVFGTLKTSKNGFLSL